MIDIELGTGDDRTHGQKQSPLAERKVADQKRKKEESEAKTKTQGESATAAAAPRLPLRCTNCYRCAMIFASRSPSISERSK